MTLSTTRAGTSGGPEVYVVAYARADLEAGEESL